MRGTTAWSASSPAPARKRRPRRSSRLRSPRRHGCIGSLFGLIVFGVALVYAVAAIIAPWSFHIGGVSTPLLYLSATGKLRTKGGTYPMYVLLYAAPRFSRLKMDGLRPTGGVQGSASLCTSPGATQYLKLSGTIYNGWSSTEDSLMSIR